MYKTDFRTAVIWGAQIADESTFKIRCQLEECLVEIAETKSRNKKWVTLEIYSGGGDFIPGLAIYDWMIQNLPNNLQTVGYGAVILLLAGTHRAASKNTRLLLHPVADVIAEQVSMNPDAHLQSAKSLLKAQDIYVDIILDRTEGKVTRKQLLKLIKDETLLTPQKALDLGIIHEII